VRSDDDARSHCNQGGLETRPTYMIASPSSSSTRERRRVLLAALVFIAVGVAAWSNSFSGPFVFDDRPAILANPTLEDFVAALAPPSDGGTVAGRPLVNLSLALNRAISGTDVWSYHALNLAIHLGCGLTLFGLIRRTLSTLGPQLSTSTAFGAALLWLVHPLQTAAVTYTIQRAESLMALWFLITLYTFCRATELGRVSDSSSSAENLAADGSKPRSTRWFVASALACGAGMTCKEVMAVSPLVVLLYDRTFVAGTFARALSSRAAYYVGLASAWAPLAWLVLMNHSRAGTVGVGGKIAWTDYALTQCTAIATYLKLALWPSRLVFDYGMPVETSFAAIWPQTLVTIALLALTALLWRRRPAAAFLGAAFFLVLAPSSSFVPIHTQTIAEHRMYLPLAVVTLATMLMIVRMFPAGAVTIACVLAVPLAAATHVRNRTYGSAIALWSDTIAKRPDNPRAHNHLAIALAQAGRPAEAIPHFQTALRLAPDDAEAHNNLGNAFAAIDRAAEALPHHETAVRLNPESPAARLNLANALLRGDRPADAIPHYAAAARLAPAMLDAATSYNYGVALVRTRQLAPAIEQFRATLATDPKHVGARVNLANALLLSGRAADAIVEYEAALHLRPDDPQIRANLALARRQQR
jgi:protein O-mannosyl-transferase